ncbi:hypothetical protein RS030_192820 [Cryptosporidium xiaoi]|uniref:Prefoldin subunit 4 n=1 Tax=Cryptosporidium xiaoi TaxID=659607 RepID=A0AAV9XZ16_9CRYT
MTNESNNTSDINMTYDDQKQINRFSSLLGRKNELMSELEKLKESLQTHNDALEEITLCMDPEGLLIRFGESYYNASEEEATERIEQLKIQVQSNIDTLSDELSTVEREMSSLKTSLYLKFGSNINLDE